MADNLTTPAVGTVLAADDVSGVLYPRSKIAFGVDGSAQDVDGTHGLPVAILAGTALIGKTSCGEDTSTVFNGTTAVTPAYQAIDAASSGLNTLRTPAGGKKIRVLALTLIPVGTAVNVYLLTGSTAVLGSSSHPIVLDKTGATGQGGLVLPYNPKGWFEGAADELFKLSLSTSQAVVGTATVVEL